ncbi:MAG TPA: hypothetical protein PLW86_00690 [Rhodocyclaceae bacterium]|nr:hypothetical protein [Rhodocyclaceae bacterium]
MKLYITNLSLLVLLLLYLPVVLWGLRRLWRSQQLRGLWKAGVMMLAIVLAYALPLGDVTVNSMAMGKACPKAGLHIYRTVEVEGFIGRYRLSDTPYQFIEMPMLRTDGTYYWNRSERNPDDSIRQKKLEQPTAEYEVVDGQWHVDKVLGVERKTDVIRNRVSGELLAERNLFNPLPGWIDKVLVVRWFGTGGSHGCWGTPSAGIAETKILIPKQPKN